MPQQPYKTTSKPGHINFNQLPRDLQINIFQYDP